MNQMMKNMMGENGEKQMHITLGKRSSGCDTSGFTPMMNMMMSGWNGVGVFGWWLAIFTWLVWLIVGVLAAIWLWKQINKKRAF